MESCKEMKKSNVSSLSILQFYTLNKSPDNSILKIINNLMNSKTQVILNNQEPPNLSSYNRTKKRKIQKARYRLMSQ
jgi:SET domain-containing protein